MCRRLCYCVGWQNSELVGKVNSLVVWPKFEYYLIDFGKSIIPAIGAIGQWGDENDERLRSLLGEGGRLGGYGD